MAKLNVKAIKENAITVLQTKKQVIKFIKKYDFEKPLTIMKVNDNYIVQKGSDLENE